MMHSALGPDQITRMPDAATPAKAAIRLTGPTLILLRGLLAHQHEEFFGAQIHARTGIDNGTLYPQLKMMERAGWLTSRPEAEGSWLGRVPVGCGPGRRRTYYALTPDGLRAAAHEVQHHKPRRRPGQLDESFGVVGESGQRRGSPLVAAGSALTVRPMTELDAETWTRCERAAAPAIWMFWSERS
jgi:DNA-binding PadR family transcriptional regulator